MEDKLKIVRAEVENSLELSQVPPEGAPTMYDLGYLRGKAAAYSYVLGLLDFAEGLRPLQRVGGS